MIESTGVILGTAGIFLAILYFAVWKRSGFWLPTYVHVLAAVGLLIGVWIVATTSPDAPIASWGIGGTLFELFICPALVYFFFVFYGGQTAALARRRQPKDPDADRG